MQNIIISRRQLLPSALMELLPPQLCREVEETVPAGAFPEELRLRRGRVASVTVAGQNLRLSTVLSGKELDDLLFAMCDGSLYAHSETVCQGYLTLQGGIRVGVCGKAGVVDGRITGIFEPTALVVRIPHATPSIGHEIDRLLRKMALCKGVLIYAPPGVGKTTLLRGVIALAAGGEHPLRVAVVDTRGELSYALDYAMRAFELFELATPQEDGDGRIHLPGRTFRSILRSFAAAALGANGQVASPDGVQGEAYEILFSEEEINDEEYKTWLVSQIQEHITYLFLVYLDNPDLDEEERQEMLALAIRYGEAAVHNLNLLRPLPGNAEYADLFLGYTYRNLSLFCHMAGQEARAEENERLAFAVRKRLYDTISRNENVNPELKDYIALEYFLEITDIIPGMKDKYQAEDWKEEIRDYVEERKKRESNRSMMFIRLCSALKKLT